MSRSRRPTAAITAALTALSLTTAGCTTLPGDSAPEAVSSYAPTPDSNNVITPTKDEASDLLLRNFFRASAHPLGNYQAARKFLTPAAEKQWDSGQDTLILDRIDITSEGAAQDGRITYRVRGNVVGTLGPGGVYNPEYTAYETSYQMVRVDGQWRVDNLRDGVLLDRADFTEAYDARNIYFVEPKLDALVPDRRWVYNRQQSLGSSLVSLLATGPQSILAKGVKSYIPAGATVQTSVPDGGGFSVDFTGLTELQARDRELLAAQVVWTLATNDVRGPYSISADGAPLTEAVGNPWTVNDVSQFDPRREVAMPLRAVVNGSVQEVQNGSAQRVEGWLATENVESAAVAPQESVFAVVSEAGAERRKLMVGRADNQPVEAIQAGSLTRPSWGSNSAALYTVADGRRIMRFTRSATTGEISRTEIDTSALGSIGISSTAGNDAGEGRISVFQVSPDGARAVLLVNGRVYISVLEDNGNGRTVMGRPVEIGVPLGDSAVSAGWRTDNTVVVGTRASDAPVWTIAADGSVATQMTSRNLTAPVVAVESVGTVTYATDSRALMQIDSAEAETRFWREEPTLQGQRAVPVFAY
ncbi:MtrAB system accessory lipoprotein LpqB [Corynebacterium heidelbergense]|uniref:Lipoprotein LpqB n=1 Tax=Corynebacterium heidelbergense TaxID=2055947 RepID=A0A364V5T3_9CORY|nr:MtrAB system accessory lipoprotein LpqB [Corynebacterium heidelbergense]RAV31979.1 MtrAB system accessory protein LpqB [Corynebacterium heidelbergense]